MCVRDVDGDSKSFAAMDMLPFSTTSAAGHEVQVGECKSFSFTVIAKGSVVPRSAMYGTHRTLTEHTQLI